MFLQWLYKILVITKAPSWGLEASLWLKMKILQRIVLILLFSAAVAPDPKTPDDKKQSSLTMWMKRGISYKISMGWGFLIGDF